MWRQCRQEAVEAPCSSCRARGGVLYGIRVARVVSWLKHPRSGLDSCYPLVTTFPCARLSMVGRRAGVRLGLSVGATMVGSSQTQASGKSTKDRRHPGFFKVLLRYVDKPFRVAGKLTFVAFILGAFGSLTGVYVQYTAWREEKNIARYNEDLKNSIATLSELSGTLSAIMNLQQILFYTFREALEKISKLITMVFTLKTPLRCMTNICPQGPLCGKISTRLLGRQKFSLICPRIQNAFF